MNISPQRVAWLVASALLAAQAAPVPPSVPSDVSTVGPGGRAVTRANVPLPELFHQAHVALQQQQPQQAAHWFALARNGSRAAHNRSAEAQAERGWAEALAAARLPAAALRHWQAARVIFHSLQARPAELRVLLEMASFQDDQGVLKSAESLLTDALTVASSLKDVLQVAEVRHRRGEVEAELGDSDASLRDLEVAAAIYRQKGDTASLTTLLTSMGRRYREEGDTEAALKAFQEAAGLQPDATHQALLELESGLVLMDEHQDSAALALVKQSQAVLNQSGAPADQAPLALALGQLQQALGQVDAALASYEQAASLYHGEDADGEAGARYRAGLLLAAGEQRKEALAQLQDGVDVVQGRGQAPVLVPLLMAESLMQLSQGAMQDGLHSAEEAQKLAADLDEPVLQSRANGVLGTLQEAQGLRSQALVSFELAAGLARTYNDLGELWRWQWGMGRMLEAAGHDDDALKQYQAAIDTEERVPLPSVDNFGFYLDEPSGPYRSAIHTLLRQGDAGLLGLRPPAGADGAQTGAAQATLLLAERSRRLQFAQSLAAVPFLRMWPGRDDTGPSGLRPPARADGAQTAEREESLLFRLQALTGRLPGASAAVARRRAQAIDDLLNDEASTRKALLQSQPILGQALSPALETTLPTVPEDTAIMEFFELPNAVVRWTVTSRGVTVSEHVVPRRELEDAVQQVTQKVASGASDWGPPAAQLYQTLLGDAQPVLDAAPHLVIVPCRALCGLSFAALPADATAVPSSCLGLTHSVELSPSLQVPTAAVHLEPRLNVVASQAPTFAALQRAMPAGGTLMLELPVQACWNNPLGSTVQLADGPHTLLELLGLSPAPSLWAVSGTQVTGRGGAELWQCLSRGVLEGGQSRLAMALWAGDPAVLQQVYGHLPASGSLSAALQAAERDVAAHNPNPHDWAWLEVF